MLYIFLIVFYFVSYLSDVCSLSSDINSLIDVKYVIKS